MNRTIHQILLTALTLFWHCYLFGSSVPVFRYALERWQADPYSIIVFYKNKLTEKEEKVVNYYKKFAETGSSVTLSVIDLDRNDLPKEAKELAEKCAGETIPFVVVRYPFQNDIKQLAGVFPLDMKSALQLMESPAGREVARRLLEDDSAVFLQIDGDNPEDNKRSADIVLKLLKKMNNEFKLSNKRSEDNKSSDEKSKAYDDKSLEIKFSFMRISRKNSADRAFIDTLLNSEKDLKKVKSAIVFPVYGRARALFSFSGDGINSENLVDAGRFLTGECSFEIKAQNPGFDMLIPVTWDSLIDYQIQADDELPPLTGLTSAIIEKKMLENAPIEKIDLKKISKVEHSAEKSPLILNMVIALIGIAFLFAGIALVMNKR